MSEENSSPLAFAYMSHPKYEVSHLNLGYHPLHAFSEALHDLSIRIQVGWQEAKLRAEEVSCCINGLVELLVTPPINNFQSGVKFEVVPLVVYF